MGTTIGNIDWRSSGILAAISRDAMFPAQQETLSNDDLMKMVREVIKARIVPMLLGLNSGYYLNTQLIPVIASSSRARTIGNGATFGNNVGYALPPDAIGRKCKEVAVINSNGQSLTMPVVTAWQIGSSGPAQGCFIDNDTLYLFPAPVFNALVSIELIYPAAPLALCDDTGTLDAGTPASAQVVALSTSGSTATATLSTMPASFTIGAGMNFVHGTPMFAAGPAADILALPGGNSFTFDASVLTDSYGRSTVSVGDWVANQGYSPFVEVPDEVLPLVVIGTIVKVMQSMRDSEGEASAEKTYITYERAARLMLAPRIDDSPMVLTTRGRGINAYTRRNWPWSNK